MHTHSHIHTCTHTPTHSGQAYSESDNADDGTYVWFGAIKKSHAGWSSDVITWRISIPGNVYDSHLYVAMFVRISIDYTQVSGLCYMLSIWYSLTFWGNVFIHLHRVRWQDWYHFHVNMKQQMATSLTGSRWKWLWLCAKVTKYTCKHH